jgi:tetratricopeptide (TPR) repeat protein
MCPTVYLGDSGELTAAAFSLGIAHGSGYPLYTLIGKLFCLIPVGNIAFRMNLMSACLGVVTVWLVYSLIFRVTVSHLAAFVGSLFLAFTPVFWFQMVSAEVYTLHAFFVALVLRLLWWWDERREFFILVLFVFVVGLSFGNHLQTVMLAPGVLWIVLSGDRRALWNVRHFIILALFFMIPVLVYVYLPIRTEAGAAIHWGDPNTWDRFWAHVSGRSHRGSYVMNETVWESVVRTKEALWFVWSQFGVVLFLSVWGWVKLSVRWRVFWVLVIVFDFIYTVFLNTISLKITPFNLVTCIGLAVLMGVGVKHVVEWVRGIQGVGANTRRVVKLGFGLIPVMALVLNFHDCDQSKNYTAYEHGINMFRTTESGDTLIVMGDNYCFPLIYGRMVERMKEAVRIYDRLNLVFKYPSLSGAGPEWTSSWDAYRSECERRLIEEKGEQAVFYAVFDPKSIRLPDPYTLMPYGVLYRVQQGKESKENRKVPVLWPYYATESFYQDFERDFMTRELYGYHFFHLGRFYSLTGQADLAMKSMKRASDMAFDNPSLNMVLAIFLIENGALNEARRALEKASLYHEDKSYVHYIWGFYHTKRGAYEQAVDAFSKAVGMKPLDYRYYNGLAFAYHEAGKEKEAALTFRESLALKGDQPEIKSFVEKYGLNSIKKDQ